MYHRTSMIDEITMTLVLRDILVQLGCFPGHPTRT